MLLKDIMLYFNKKNHVHCCNLRILWPSLEYKMPNNVGTQFLTGS